MDKILVIDSSAESLDLLSQRLTYFDYNVLTADSGVAGLTKAKLFQPDLIILDTQLPDMSGFDLCKKVKENEDTKLVLVLFISSLETKDVNIRAFEVGADDIIEKTSDSIILVSKVKSLLRVKHLIRQLGAKYAELSEKDKILDYQLKMGRHVQRALIKDYDFEINDVRFLSKYLPALDIGGDFYNIANLGEGRVGVIIGDVSGHGIAAALLTSMLSMMFQNLSARYTEPNELLRRMNNQFFNIFDASASEMYSCVFYAVFDTRNKTISYSNAGQCLPLLSNGETAEELESFGVPIGIMKDSSYELKTVEYKPGDLILFHTDGLSDNLYKGSSEEFSEYLKEIALNSRAETPDEVLNILLSSFYKYNPSASEKYDLDDVSIILCKINESGEI